MKALRLIAPGRPLELHEIPLPDLTPRDVLIKVKAAGICHSDAHYRAGTSPVHPLPLTLGHEVSGVIEAAGSDVQNLRKGDRVSVHYLATCGNCRHCHEGSEQFCHSAAMIGKHRDGGYAEFIVMPARSVFPLPDEIDFATGAILMCSSATSLHALNKGRLRAGESVAIFGCGGLGMSAIQLAKALGANDIFAIDIDSHKLELAGTFGAIPINAATLDPVEELRRLTAGRGIDVALELAGVPITMSQAVQCLAIKGRVAMVGITQKSFEVAPYRDLINKEAEIIGISDHLAQELPALIEWTRRGKLNLSRVVSRSVPLEADAVNQVLDDLAGFGPGVRVVITL